VPAQQVKIVATFTINDYEKFVVIASEMVEHCKQHEPDTLVYDWYVDADKKEGRLLELYTDTEAFRQHVTGKIFTDIVPKMGNAIAWQSLEAFGELPSEFDPVMKMFPSKHWINCVRAL